MSEPSREMSLEMALLLAEVPDCGEGELAPGDLAGLDLPEPAAGDPLLEVIPAAGRRAR